MWWGDGVLSEYKQFGGYRLEGKVQCHRVNYAIPHCKVFRTCGIKIELKGENAKVCGIKTENIRFVSGNGYVRKYVVHSTRLG